MKSIPDIVRALSDSGVQFVLVGGFAVQLHGFVRTTIREKGMLAFALREPQVAGSVIDVLVRPEVTFDKLNLDAAPVELFGCKIKIASIEHLLLMKRAANRPKDRIDIEALEKIQRGEDPYV